MDAAFVRLFMVVVVGFAITTLGLAAARRALGQRGFDAASAFCSLTWWFLIDAAMLILAYLFTSSMYKNWFPAEAISENALLAELFAHSDLAVSDWTALVFILLVAVLGHSLAFAGIVLVQSILGETIFGRAFWMQALGLATVAFVYFYFMYQWESPVLALRTAELVGDKSVDKLLDNIVSIPNVSTILGQSWLLTTIWFIWPILILFVSWGATRSKIVYHNACDAIDAPEATRQENGTQMVQAPLRSEPLDVNDASVNVEHEQLIELDHRPHDHNGRDAHHAIQRAHELTGMFTEREQREEQNGNGVAVQELLNQLEEQRQKTQALEDENRNIRRTHAHDPLRQTNRDGTGQFFEGETTNE